MDQPRPDVRDLLDQLPDELIKLAGDRGKKLWIETSRNGDPMITDGAKRYLLPRLPEGLIPPDLVEILVALFFGSDLLAVDFALDPREDD
ncbi:MAG: hypothetical protein QOF89_433 [Acidobacteriota bacterium]|jgi:hypothetical protein|nr:hypothetical protein [Acidobacteriota bacterium]